MGNKVPSIETPKKSSKNNILDRITPSKKSKSAQKDGLYAEDKIFENFESKTI
jgi:hypothetical protein